MTMNLSMSTTVMTKIRLITPLLTLMTFRHSLFLKYQLAILLFVTQFEKSWFPCTQQQGKSFLITTLRTRESACSGIPQTCFDPEMICPSQLKATGREVILKVSFNLVICLQAMQLHYVPNIILKISVTTNSLMIILSG